MASDAVLHRADEVKVRNENNYSKLQGLELVARNPSIHLDFVQALAAKSLNEFT